MATKTFDDHRDHFELGNLQTTISMVIQLSAVIPASLASAKVVVHGDSSSGDKLMCLNMEVSKQLPELD